MIAILFGNTSSSFQAEGYFDDLTEQLIISVRGRTITLGESFRNRKIILSGPRALRDVISKIILPTSLGETSLS